MTTSLRHPQLDHKERAALETLGVPLDDPNLTIEISWDKSWRNVGQAPDSDLPIQWSATYGITMTINPPIFSGHAFEHGPEPVTETMQFEDEGTLTSLAATLSKILNAEGLDDNECVDLNICGWALWAAGHLA